ncbi:uncharacterized protein LOC134272564, partial [Saccostrea cucullata]|uniref:uncharacterized protein LOC134272564 n=1 Tax=Saccostrea cuccullata TaxID=36930 RepID=UPI002ED5C6EA
NIAYKRPAWQKTTHPSNFGPEKAVDGLKSDLSANGHQCSISKNKQRIASWRVNLLGIKFIHHVVIYYRTDNKIWDENNSLRGRFLGFSVYISNTENKDDGRLCFHDTEYNMTTIPAVVNITCELYGQYVIYYNERNADTLYPPGYSTFAYNELCEVEVYVNLAYNQPTWQKASHPADFGPEKAVDGLKSDLSARGHQCTVSADTERVAIWRVKLAMYSFIRNVVIYYRTNNIEWGENNAFAGRFLGFSIYISDSESKENGTLCFHDTENNRTTIPAVVNITCELYGQYVIYYNERSADTVYPPGYSTYAYNELCELEVYGFSSYITTSVPIDTQFPSNTL